MLRRLCPSLAVVALVACGGSSSESPWPREPDNLDGDPSGEGAPADDVVDVTKLPNNYDDDGSGGARNDADEKDAE